MLKQSLAEMMVRKDLNPVLMLDKEHALNPSNNITSAIDPYTPLLNHKGMRVYIQRYMCTYIY